MLMKLTPEVILLRAASTVQPTINFLSLFPFLTVEHMYHLNNFVLNDLSMIGIQTKYILKLTPSYTPTPLRQPTPSKIEQKLFLPSKSPMNIVPK